jgi:hypothetical protein
VIGAHEEVFLDAHAGEDLLALRHEGEAERRPLLRRHVVDHLAVEDDLALLHGDEADDGLQRRRLARAVAAEQGDEAAFRHLEADPVQDAGAAVAGDDAVNLEHGASTRFRYRLPPRRGP